MTTPTRRPPRRKRFAQHFLASSWAEKIVRAIAPQPGDVFLEIGPGRGALTLPLAASGAPILAVEIDRDLTSLLASIAPRNVTIVGGDFLKLDVLPYLTGLEPQRPPSETDSVNRLARGPVGIGSRSEFRPRFRVVGNLPYNISSPVLFRLIELQRQHRLFFDATIMLQREVADRLVARPGTREYGVLGIMLALQARATRLLALPPGAFSPPPKVHSAVIALTFEPMAVRMPDERLFERMIKAVFSQRRKTLSNALKAFDRRGPEILAASGFDGRRRPETLQVQELARLAELFASAERPAVL